MQEKNQIVAEINTYGDLLNGGMVTLAIIIIIVLGEHRVRWKYV